MPLLKNQERSPCAKKETQNILFGLERELLTPHYKGEILHLTQRFCIRVCKIPGATVSYSKTK